MAEGQHCVITCVGTDDPDFSLIHLEGAIPLPRLSSTYPLLVNWPYTRTNSPPLSSEGEHTKTFLTPCLCAVFNNTFVDGLRVAGDWGELCALSVPPGAGGLLSSFFSPALGLAEPESDAGSGSWCPAFGLAAAAPGEPGTGWVPVMIKYRKMIPKQKE